MDKEETLIPSQGCCLCAVGTFSPWLQECCLGSVFLPHPRAGYGGEWARLHCPSTGVGGGGANRATAEEGAHLRGSALCPELKGQAPATLDPEME